MMPGGKDGCPAAAAATTTTTTGGTTAGGGAGAGSATMTTGMKKGPWTATEDAILVEYVRKHGEGNWNAVQKNSGLSRCGKSCRLRWANHLRPNLKKGSFSPDEERLILELHAKLGNKWARMAAQLPGRTDNEIKNYWNTRIKRRHRAGLPLYPPDIQRQAAIQHHNRPPTSATTPPPLPSDHKTQFSASGAVPLSLFDPINFSTGAATTTATASALLGFSPHQPFMPVTNHHQRVKRYRDDDLSFSLPFSTSPAPSPPLQNSMFQFNSLGNYDPRPPPPPALQHQQQNFSVKMELPSSQLFPGPIADTAGGGGGALSLGRSNSGLLDALFQEAEGVGGSNVRNDSSNGGSQQRDGFQPEPSVQNVKWVHESSDAGGCGPPQGLNLESGSKWDDLNRLTETKMKREPTEEIGSADDLSALLDIIPMASIPTSATTAVHEWYNSDSGEVSNGQSSGVTDDDIGLEMQQLASSLSIGAKEDNSWSIGSCHWNDMPGSIETFVANQLL